jgi:acyl-homoserine-lactone acylase
LSNSRHAAWLLILLAGCAPLTGIVSGGAPADARMARDVTIVRDSWGVPTIYGPTDAAVAFGVAYAQAEDDFWHIEESFIHGLGRASHYYGEAYLAADLVKAAFEVERLAREEYAREPPERKAIWDAYAAGLNYWLRTAPDARPRLIGRYEPWMLFAIQRTVSSSSVIDGVRLDGVVDVVREVTPAGAVIPVVSGSNSAGPVEAAPEAPDRWPGESTVWAVAGARTESGHALLLQGAHAVFAGPDQLYEMQVHSDAGWHVRGVALLGTPVPRAGHNAVLAWSHVPTAADHADVFDVAFDHPDNPLAYRYDDEWRHAVEWEDTLRVNTAAGVARRVYRFRRTHHGPVVAMRDGSALVVRVARVEEGGALQQWYDMGRAGGLDDFRAALDRRALLLSTMYADRVGNIYYLHGNAVPRREASLDWSRPVDGNTSLTDWRGWHELDELPQLLNPASGWLQNSGSTPFQATASGHNLDVAAYPSYMAPEPDNGRARSSRRLLEGATNWTLERLAEAAFDGYVTAAEDALRQLVHEWEQVGGTHPQRAMRVDEAVDALRGWDRIATVESPAMTLFVLWQEQLHSGRYDGEFGQFRALEDVTAELRHEFGSALVPWGDVNRLQRSRAIGAGSVHDDLPSLPVVGGPGWAGIVFSLRTSPGVGVRRYATGGRSWISVAELAPAVRSRSIVPFGQSADPGSANFFDQAPLYARGALKPAWFTREEVSANAQRVQRLGVDR